MKRLGILLSVVIAVSSSRPGLAAPPIGEKAPAINVSKWMNGPPPALPGGKAVAKDAAKPGAKPAGKEDDKAAAKESEQKDGKHVFVVEFWATWCGPCRKSIPHLAELHKKKEKDGLVIIGISNEEPETIAEFLKPKKDGKAIDMPYFVAADDENASTDAWMEDIEGIPHAFVVNQQGIVVWQGNPLDTAKLDSTIEQVLAGKFDVEAAKKEAAADKQYEKLLADLQAAYPMHKEEVIFKLLDEMISLKPKVVQTYMIKRAMLVEFEKTDKLADLDAKVLETFKDDSANLLEIVDIEFGKELAQRSPVLMVRCMARACELMKKPDPEVLSQLARVQCECGQLDAAIKSQTKAAAAAPEDQQESYKKTLAYYEGLKQLGDSLPAKPPVGASE
jgi:thiol-disulfide isomerase/thioredoxin